MTPPVVLALGGTDSGGAAGLAADLATVGHLGAHGACVATAVTAQDTTGVRAVHPVPVDVVGAQLDAVLDDLPVAVVKAGMLGSAEVARLVVDRLGHLPLVVDPVLAATSGARLGDAGVVQAYRDHLLPRATLATPNLAEARTLAGRDEDAAGLAARLADLGCAVVVTGGPEWRPGEPVGTCTDWLCLPGGRPDRLDHPAVPTTNDHGTGCTFASAVAAALATVGPPASARLHEPQGGPNGAVAGAAPPSVHGPDVLRSALRRAAAYVTGQLATGSAWQLGRGRGPIAHTAPARRHPDLHP